MKYKVTRNKKYDYLGQSSSTLYPNLHKYPATMLPQIGIDLLKELDIKSGSLLDPYCGTGSSFICALECGIKNITGFDINPLAALISKVKFTSIDVMDIESTRQELRNNIFEFLKTNNTNKIKTPHITNIDFWFSKEVINNLSLLKHFLVFYTKCS